MCFSLVTFNVPVKMCMLGTIGNNRLQKLVLCFFLLIIKDSTSSIYPNSLRFDKYYEEQSCLNKIMRHVHVHVPC